MSKVTEESYYAWAESERFADVSVDAENVGPNDGSPDYWQRRLAAGRDAVALRKEERSNAAALARWDDERREAQAMMDHDAMDADRHRIAEPEQFGVQPWSQGDIYPAVIATRERYQAFRDGAEWQDVCGPCYPVRYFLGEREAFYAQPLADRLRSVSAVLILDGQECEYASYADARSAALALIGSPFLRAQWQAGKGEM